MGIAPRRNLDEVEPPVMLHERAADNLTFIRDAMTRASAFTAVPGRGTVLMGLIALLGGAVAALRLTPYWWVNAWCLTALVAATQGFVAVAWKARRTSTPLFSGPGMRVLGNFAPPIVAGAILTLLFYNLRLTEWLPGLWLLLYGTGVVCAGAFSVRIVPAMGLSFMTLSLFAFIAIHYFQEPLFGPVYAGDAAMALGFGGLNIVFGFVIARRHGG